jgi:spore photoproduct lyase
MTIKTQETKTLITRSNTRSADAISPNFIFGCAGTCKYCYSKRNKNFRENVYLNKNTDEILSNVNDWTYNQQWPKVPNQVDPNYYFVDIGCSTDIPLMWKQYDWPKVLEWFGQHERCAATFATKWVNYDLLPHSYNKNRIRFSLMPQHIADIVEPKMSPISKRIEAINHFKAEGWEVHINFSPIIAYKGHLDDYKRLFEEVDKNISDKNKVFAECIYLTHAHGLHNINLEAGLEEAEKLMWTPQWQENKQSQYKSSDQVVRYNYELKKELVRRFRELHDEVIPWNTIRYIF